MPYIPPTGDLLPFALSGADYTPPTGSAVAFDMRFYPPYVAPPGNMVALDFSGAYTPPLGSEVALEFVKNANPVGDTQYLFPLNYDAALYGDGLVRKQYEIITASGIAVAPAGFPSTRNSWTFARPSAIAAPIPGRPSVILKDRPVAPPGIAAYATGFLTIINRNRYVFAGNIQAPSLTAPTIYLYTRYLKPGGYVATQIPATMRISLEKQRVQLNAGIAVQPMGTAWISHGTRTLSPAGSMFMAVGRPLVGGTRYLLAQGWDASAYGTRIIPVSQSAYPQGFVGVLGAAAIKNKLTFASPLGFETNGQEQFRWGRPTTFNRRQVISLFYDPDSQLNPPGWSPWTAIYNRNRVVGHFSGPVARVGEPLIENGARLIAASGMTPPGYPGTVKAGLVAYGVRRLPLDGIEPPLMSRWASVNNAARVLLPPGLLSSSIGQSSLENTRRYYRFVGNFDALSVGLPFVAFAIRGVSMEPRYAIAPPVVQLPEIKLYTRYIDGPGSDMSRIGAPALTIRFNIIAPKWVLRDFVGDPRLHNVTPEVRTNGRNSEAFGDALVRLQYRRLPVDGYTSMAFGRAKIADRTGLISTLGINSMRVADKLVVTKTGAPPYSPQNIIMDRLIDSESAFGRPDFNQRAIFPSGISSLKVGVLAIHSNGIRVDFGIKFDDYGTPDVSLKNRRVTVAEWPDSLIYQPSTPRLSPHTIWAVKEAPQQAKDNHPPRSLHYVGEINTFPYVAPGERFGNPRITKNLYLIERASAGDRSDVPRPVLTLKRRFITPPGLQAYRFGWAKASDGREFIVQFGSLDSQLFGKPGIARAPYYGPQTIRATGLAATPVSALTWVSLLHRTFATPGINSLAMGSSRGGSPYQWQSLNVGPLMPTIPKGFDSQALGSAWVSLRVRNLGAEGFDTFTSTYELAQFAKRMRVRNAAMAEIPTQTILPVGGSGLSIGVPNIRLGVHYIRPDGDADQYRKGAF